MNCMFQDYVPRIVGVQERIVPQERIATEELRESILQSVDAWLSGKSQGRAVRLVSTDVEAMEIVEHTAKLDKQARRKVWERRPTKIAGKHILAAKLHRRTRGLEEFDSDGKRVQPFVALVLVDGSRIEIPFVEIDRAGYLMGLDHKELQRMAGTKKNVAKSTLVKMILNPGADPGEDDDSGDDDKK